MTPFWRLFRYVRRYRRAFLVGLLCSFIATGIPLAAPRVLQYAVDDLTAGVTRGKLALYGSALLAIGVLGGIFRFWMRRILIAASRDIEYDLRNDFFAHLQLLPLSYFQANRTGDLMARATNDLNAVRMMIGPSVMYSADTGLTFVTALAMMIAIDLRLTLLSLIPLPFVSLSVWYFGNAIHRGFERIQAQVSDLSAVAQEALSGVRVIRAYRQEEAEIARFQRANEELVRRNRALIAVQGLFFPSMSLFLGFGSMLVLWLGSRHVINGIITVGEFVAFFAYLSMLAWPMIAFGWVTTMVQRGMASWKRMLEVFDTVPAISDDEGTQSTQRTQGSAALPDSRTAREFSASSAVSAFQRREVHGEIEFRDLSFSYGPTQVLCHVSVHIPAGQTAAIVGETGSGKSTLIGLLARLHDPPPGTVFIDGVDVREWPLATLRGSIGFVPQEPFLFSDSIADNVAFGLDGQDGREGSARGHASARTADPNASIGVSSPRGCAPSPRLWRVRRSSSESGERRLEAPAASAEEDGRDGQDGQEGSRQARIEAAAAVARLDKDLADFPNGYETMVGERGITLSGGQKQRTAIARALVIDPTILILDDSLSAVDTYTEEEILSRLRRVMRQRTSIIVSHRISTVQGADQIFVLDRGRIVERGAHDELIRHDGLYAALHRKQLLEDELAAS